jgi:hypothetical protein
VESSCFAPTTTIVTAGLCVCQRDIRACFSLSLRHEIPFRPQPPHSTRALHTPLQVFFRYNPNATTSIDFEINPPLSTRRHSHSQTTMRPLALLTLLATTLIPIAQGHHWFWPKSPTVTISMTNNDTIASNTAAAMPAMHPKTRECVLECLTTFLMCPDEMDCTHVFLHCKGKCFKQARMEGEEMMRDG